MNTKNPPKLTKNPPTASEDALKAIFSILIINGWDLKPIDMKTPFLQDEFLKRQIYLKPSAEANYKPKEI